MRTTKLLPTKLKTTYHSPFRARKKPMPCDNFFAEVISVTRGFKVALAEELHFRILLLYPYSFT